MTLKITRAEPRPASSIRSRHSQCRDIYEKAEAADTKTVTVEAETTKELDAIYKSMIQWRKRHGPEGAGDMPCTVNRDGRLIYVTAGRYEHTPTSEDAD